MVTQDEYEPGDEALAWQVMAEEPEKCGFSLALTSSAPKIAILPSWIPNIARSSSDYPAYDLPWVRDDQAFYAGGLLRMGGEVLLKDAIDIDEATARIYVKGAVVDIIGMTCMLPHMLHFELAHTSRPFYIYNLAMLCLQLVEAAAEEGKLPYDGDVDTVLSRILVADGCGSTMQSLFPFENFYDDLGNELERYQTDRDQAKLDKLKLYWTTYRRLCKSVDVEIFPLDASYADILPSDMDVETKQIIQAYHRCLEETLEGHIFFQTKEKGFFGLAPLLVAPNDSIIILPGVRLPLIVRASEVDDPQRPGEKLGGNVLLGPCFAHGLMYGDHKREYLSAIPLI